MKIQLASKEDNKGLYMDARTKSAGEHYQLVRKVILSVDIFSEFLQFHQV